MSTGVDGLSIIVINTVGEMSTSVDMPNQDHAKAVRVMSTEVDHPKHDSRWFVETVKKMSTEVD